MNYVQSSKSSSIKHPMALAVLWNTCHLAVALNQIMIAVDSVVYCPKKFKVHLDQIRHLKDCTGSQVKFYLLTNALLKLFYYAAQELALDCTYCRTKLNYKTHKCVTSKAKWRRRKDFLNDAKDHNVPWNVLAIDGPWIDTDFTSVVGDTLSSNHHCSWRTDTVAACILRRNGMKDR